jgi:hypothetical protein
MRLIQCPHVSSVPALVDIPYHTVKDRWAAGGGQDSYFVIDTDGVVAHRSGGAFHPLDTANEMEHALARVVGLGGKGVLPRNTGPLCYDAARPTVVLRDATTSTCTRAPVRTRSPCETVSCGSLTGRRPVAARPYPRRSAGHSSLRNGKCGVGPSSSTGPGTRFQTAEKARAALDEAIRVVEAMDPPLM